MTAHQAGPHLTSVQFDGHDTNMTTKMAEIIKRLRKQRGWTQPVFARKAGLAEVTVARIECGMLLDPRVSTVRKLAKALKVPIIKLLE